MTVAHRCGAAVTGWRVETLVLE